MSEIGYQTSQIPGWGQMLTEAHEPNPELMFPRLFDVVDRMYSEDAQIQSVMRAVIQPIMSTEWEVAPGAAPEEVVNLVAGDLGLKVQGSERVAPLRTRGRFSWNEHLRLSLTSLRYGLSVFEQEYRFDETDRLQHLKKLAWRPPRTIAEIKVARDGGLIGIHQYGVDQLIGVDRLVMYVPEKEGANWLGRSILRPAFRDWLLKDRFMRVQLIAAERNGLGMPVYEGAPIPEGSRFTDAEAQAWHKAEREAGLKIAKQAKAGTESGISIPGGAKFSFVGVTGTTPDMDKPIRYHDEQIARAVLAHFLNLGTETGSWALGSTFADFFTNSLNAVAQYIASIMQAHVVEDLVDLNFGTSMPAPQIVPAKIGAKHPKTAESIKALLDSKAITPDDLLEQDIRSTFSLPPRQSSEGAAGATDAERARYAAEAVQKVYLGGGPVLTQPEARELVRRAGADITRDPLDSSAPTPEGKP